MEETTWTCRWALAVNVGWWWYKDIAIDSSLVTFKVLPACLSLSRVQKPTIVAIDRDIVMINHVICLAVIVLNDDSSWVATTWLLKDVYCSLGNILSISILIQNVILVISNANLIVQLRVLLRLMVLWVCIWNGHLLRCWQGRQICFHISLVCPCSQLIHSLLVQKVLLDLFWSLLIGDNDLLSLTIED